MQIKLPRRGLFVQHFFCFLTQKLQFHFHLKTQFSVFAIILHKLTLNVKIYFRQIFANSLYFAFLKTYNLISVVCCCCYCQLLKPPVAEKKIFLLFMMMYVQFATAAIFPYYQLFIPFHSFTYYHYHHYYHFLQSLLSYFCCLGSVR